MQIAYDLALALDPVLMARELDIEPDLWQAQILRSEAKQLILNCSRQAGKSTGAGLLAVHTACFVPNALILVLAPALRQSQELFRRIKQLYLQIPTAPSLRAESALQLELENGSRIIALPGQEQTIRTYSNVQLLIVDEASRVADELYYSVRPMLAVSGGKIALLSTPYGKRGFFYTEWSEGGPGWERIHVRATEVSRIPSAWLAEERARIGDWWYAQEYDCQFVETTDQVFSHEHVMGALSTAVTPLFGG